MSKSNYLNQIYVILWNSGQAFLMSYQVYPTGYLKNQTVTRRRHDVNDQDRLFSNSSLTSIKVCLLFPFVFVSHIIILNVQQSIELMDGDESAMDDGTGSGGNNTRNPTPGVTTVVLPPAPRTQPISAAQSKKDRDRDYQRRKRANALKNAMSGEDDTDASSSKRPNKRARED